MWHGFCRDLNSPFSVQRLALVLLYHPDSLNTNLTFILQQLFLHFQVWEHLKQLDTAIPRAKIRVITVIMPRNRERGRGQSQLRSGSSLGNFSPTTQTRNQGFFEKNLPTGLNFQRATKTPTSNVATKNHMAHGFPHWAAGCWTEWNALSFADIEAGVAVSHTRERKDPSDVQCFDGIPSCFHNLDRSEAYKKLISWSPNSTNSESHTVQ